MNTDVQKSIQQFEKRFRHAIEERFRNEPEEIRPKVIDSYLRAQIDLQEFYKSYKKQTLYDQVKLRELSSYAFDIKLEQYFIEVDIARYNDQIYIPHPGVSVPSNPRLHLIHLSLDQSLILKSRISWERFMNFIYYLETGKKLDMKRGNSKAIFKDTIIDKVEKWHFLDEYLNIIQKFDEFLRNPETHRRSILTDLFVSGKELDSDIILSIQNINLNLWSGVITIIQGGTVVAGSWNIGMDKLRELKLPF